MDYPIYAQYAKVFQEPNDIQAHLPILRDYAAKCEHVTEFGFRSGNSATAFVAGLADSDFKDKFFVTFDIVKSPEVDTLSKLATLSGVSFLFRNDNTVDPNVKIRSTDLLFINTEHTYSQVFEELTLHAEQAKKWIAFHDTENFPDLFRGISDWFRYKNGYKIVYSSRESNGLMIYERE